MTTLILFGIIVPLVTAVVTWQLVVHTLPARIVRLLEESTMTLPDHTPPPSPAPRGKTRAGRPSWLLVVTLVAAVLVILIGAQAYLDGRENRERDRDTARLALEAKKAADQDRRHDKIVEVCTQTWADEYVTVTETRVESNAELRDAERKWTRAVGRVFTVFIQALAAPPTPPGDPADPVLLAALTDALTSFASADDALRDAQRDVDDTASLNPYPSLDLNCAEGVAAADQQEK